jgi:hypothetical protein
MNTDTPRINEWETYCDECYYHLWRVRRKNERGFNDGYHVHNGEEARALVDLLNKQDSELAAVTEQRDVASQCHKWCYEDRKRIIEELNAARAEIERLDVAGIHSCHNDCQRLPCVLRRERDEARRLAEKYRNLSCDSQGETDETLLPWKTINPNEL